jgi:HD superfamily phosphohydrolase
LSVGLAKQVNDWVEKALENTHFEKVRDRKVIEDAVVGSTGFEKYEINLIDTPIIQRLRKIAQTGFAYLLFPCANHTRFEHTLGVTAMANRFCQAIKNQEPGMLKDEHYHEVRLAGLLHDVGHGPFSHVSEAAFSMLPEFQEYLQDPKFGNCTPKPHEILSYLIVTSKAFKEFFRSNIQDKDYRINADFDRIGCIIIGNMEDQWEAYLADIINGPFDADKFDYILRDCYFTGIRMAVDINRILHTVSIDTKKSFGRQGLIVDLSGSIFVEQILFNKMLLFSSLYHHHKERAAECMLKSIFEIARDKELKINGLGLDKVTDFLSLTDLDFLHLEGKPEELRNMISNLSNRSLLKRALVISWYTIKPSNNLDKTKKEDEQKTAYKRLLSIGKDPNLVRKLREMIAEKIGWKCSVYDIWIDLPEPPNFREAKQVLVKITDEQRERLDTILRVSHWLETYAENKGKGHVFCPPDHEIRKEVNKAAQDVLKEALNIEFNDFATKYAKII